VIETLEAESLALELLRRALSGCSSRAAAGSIGRRKLVDRAKLVLASDLGRRWTLAAIAADVGVSPVYLTQVFQQVEGLPLYRYQLQLRLAQALDLLGDNAGLTSLALDLGFPAIVISAPRSNEPTVRHHRRFSVPLAFAEFLPQSAASC
jgi:AraC-like DNA-binding protein